MSTLTSTFVAVPDKASPGWLERALAVFSTKASPAKATADPIEAYIQANGGVITDQMEREISRRFGSIVGG